MKLTFTLMLSSLLLLNSCGNETDQPGPGGVSAENAKALDAAAEKLDHQTAAGRQ
jgi:hypothetical protein